MERPSNAARPRGAFSGAFAAKTAPVPLGPLAAGALLAASLSLLGLAALPARGAEVSPETLGLEELYRLDLLPALRESVRVATVSSYDRTGGNDDGFSGTHSFVRKECEGLVIAELDGPGIVYRFWTPTPTDDLVEFFFDGESEPRIAIPFREIFLGKREPFLAPVVGHGAGGFYSYLPLPYARSLKIRVRAPRVQFYQIHYAAYPPGTEIESFRPALSRADRERLERARALFASAGGDVSAYAAPPGSKVEVRRSRATLRPGSTAVLFESQEGGRIVGLRISPASALAGKARSVVLRVSYDGEGPSILSPAGDFFGYAWGEPAAASLLVGVADGVAYSYLPMPFDRSARVELVHEGAEGRPAEISAETLFVREPRRAREGKLCAVWRRENPTEVGAPFTFLRAEGRGHIVGCVLQAQGFESGKTLFFEGDDQTTIDGELAIHGTGSEDFFNGGWYDVPDRWEKRLSLPLSGCLGYQKHLGRTGGYRFFLGDALAYRASIAHAIEHGGTGNSIPTDYCAVTYFYADRMPAGIELPPPAKRGVVDLETIVFPAWWQLPVHAWTFKDATLARKAERLGGEEVRSLSMRAEGQDWFGPPFLSVVCEVPAAGAYSVSIDAVAGPAQGRVQLFQDEIPAGEPVDLYAPERKKVVGAALGTLRLAEGKNAVMLKLVGKDEKSSGLALDLIQLTLRK